MPYAGAIIARTNGPYNHPFLHDQKGHLLRILGVGFGIAVIIGGIIGSGILRRVTPSRHLPLFEQHPSQGVKLLPNSTLREAK
jgi:hypothetical protein